MDKKGKEIDSDYGAIQNKNFDIHTTFPFYFFL
jgi:hypothetical protein